ncbi:helix-turn-helix domain-containing protein [Patescibacteria group bacterium]|nr:helix-turn-helix domain-containing protein [Patescibacteria group bacterium]
MIKEYIKKIKSLRLEKGISQLEVAKKIGISRNSYIAIEQGKRELTLSEAQKISDIFGIPLSGMKSGLVPDYEKYKQMILAYLRKSSLRDGKIPKTKLAKLLYLADFSWFYDHLESMSGMQYRKISYGPVPDMFFRAVDELEESGKIVVDRKSVGKKDMLLISESEGNRNEKLKTLSFEENKLIKKITAKWKDKNTNEIVNFTHNQLPFMICDDNEIIPYGLITQEDPDYVY